MPVDLTETRALLASVEGFTPGPWRAVRRMMWYFVRTGAIHVADSVGGPDAPLIAAAPTLHAHLTELADEVERLRAEVERLQEPGSVMMAYALLDLAAGEVDDV